MDEMPLTIQEAKYLMDVLENDIPSYDRSRIALLLLILAANPDLAKDGKEVVGYSPRTYENVSGYGDYDCEGYGCY